MGSHSAWVQQEVICGCGHEVLVAKPRLMERSSKRRKRKNDWIDANKLERVGRLEPRKKRAQMLLRAFRKLGRRARSHP